MRLDRQHEACLIKRAQQGNKEAFDELLTSYEQAVYGFIRGEVDQDEDAEDIAQDTWIKVWEKICTYNPNRGSFYTFLRFRGKIMVARYWRERERRHQWEISASELRELTARAGMEDEEELLDILEKTPAPEPSPEETLERWKKLQKSLEITFSRGGPPHQVIAFGFNKLIDKWSPRRIVNELSDTPLKELCNRFVEAYLLESELPEFLVRPYFEPLQATMDQKILDRILFLFPRHTRFPRVPSPLYLLTIPYPLPVGIPISL